MGIWGTPAGFAFRDLIDKWQEVGIKEDKYNNIHMLVDGQNFVLFFIFQNKVYATTEQHRVTFAKMKQPDEETSDAWVDEAKFMAFNLSDSISGKPAQEIFYVSDLEDIEIIEKEEAIKHLKEIADYANRQQVTKGAHAIMQFAKQFGGPKEPQEPPGSTGMPIQGKEGENENDV